MSSNRLPSPIMTRKKIYFLCLGCSGPTTCFNECNLCKSTSQEINLEVCLSLHNHQSFGPEIYGKERKSDQNLPQKVPEAYKEKDPEKRRQMYSSIAISKAKRSVKEGKQATLWSYFKPTGDPDKKDGSH